MAGIRLFNVHRNWEDWLAILVGVAIGFSPWLVGQQDNPAVSWNAVIIGALVIVLAGLELTGLQRWEEIAEIACGLWLIVSPFIYGYAGALRTWHFVLGIVVVLLAAWELWQDWKLSDQDLVRHGQ